MRRWCQSPQQHPLGTGEGLKHLEWNKRREHREGKDAAQGMK